jgi:mono/diheme cytochrome c family protein
MTKNFIYCTIATYLLSLLLPTVAFAQQRDDRGAVEEQLIEERMTEEELQISGKEEFIRYCSVCHGIDGKGKGPLAKNLKTPPADLTKITKRHGGFPLTKIANIIRDGGEVSGHGASDMPAWGEAFRDHVEPVLASALIFELALYLESIQEETTSGKSPADSKDAAPKVDEDIPQSSP